MHAAESLVRPFAVVRRVAAAAAFAVLSFAALAVAEAGDPVKLVVELPPDVKKLDCGESVDLQVVGEDAGKVRVPFPGKTVELSATAGTVEVVKQPYQFRYKTPATLPDVTNVRIRAWLKEAPEVAGEITISVVPPAPFKRLVLQGAASAPAGTTLDLVLKGETADGQLQDVPEATVTVKVEGPGKVSLVRAPRYRFEANADGSGTAKVIATLNRYPNVTGVHEVLVTGGTSGGTPTPPTPTPAPAPAPGSGGQEKPPAAGGKDKPSSPGGGGADKPGGKPPADDEKGPDPVTWTSGNVRLETWRIRDLDTDPWSPIDRKLPPKGGPFHADRAIHKIRVCVTAPTAAKIELEESVGEKGPVTPLPPSKDGRFQLVERKDGTRVVHYEVRLPEGNRPTTMTIVVTTSDGKVTRDEFTFRRNEPKKQ